MTTLVHSLLYFFSVHCLIHSLSKHFPNCSKNGLRRRPKTASSAKENRGGSLLALASKEADVERKVAGTEGLRGPPTSTSKEQSLVKLVQPDSEPRRASYKDALGWYPAGGSEDGRCAHSRGPGRGGRCVYTYVRCERFCTRTVSVTQVNVDEETSDEPFTSCTRIT